jgi:hypothetical protein
MVDDRSTSTELSTAGVHGSSSMAVNNVVDDRGTWLLVGDRRFSIIDDVVDGGIDGSAWLMIDGRRSSNIVNIVDGGRRTRRLLGSRSLAFWSNAET